MTQFYIWCTTTVWRLIGTYQREQEMGRDLFRDLFSGDFFFPSFLLHLPLLSALGCLLGNFVRFNFKFSASILFLCFSACLLFCVFASLLFSFFLFCFFASLFFFFFASSASSVSSASSAFLLLLILCFFAFFVFCFSASLFLCFAASLLLCFFFSLFLCFCFSAFCCFFASRLVCFRFSAFLLHWVFLFCFGVCFISLLFCVWCAMVKTWVTFSWKQFVMNPFIGIWMSMIRIAIVRWMILHSIPCFDPSTYGPGSGNLVHL